MSRKKTVISMGLLKKLTTHLRKRWEYQPERSPPNLDMAQVHGVVSADQSARMVRKLPDLNNMDEPDKKELFRQACPCCGLNPSTDQFPLCVDSLELGSYGPGYVTYFSMVKFCMLLSLIFAVFNFPKLLRNLNGAQCLASDQPLAVFSIRQTDTCRQDWMTTHSISNYGTSRQDPLDRLLMAVFLLVQLLLVSVYTAYLEGLSVKIRVETEDPKHWTLMVGCSQQIEGLDKRASEEDIKKLFEEHHKQSNAKIYKINSCYRLEEYLAALTQIQQIKKQIKQAVPGERDRIKAQLQSSPDSDLFKISQVMGSMNNIVDKRFHSNLISPEKNMVKRVNIKNPPTSKESLSKYGRSQSSVNNLQEKKDRSSNFLRLQPVKKSTLSGLEEEHAVQSKGGRSSNKEQSDNYLSSKKSFAFDDKLFSPEFLNLISKFDVCKKNVAQAHPAREADDRYTNSERKVLHRNLFRHAGVQRVSDESA